MYDTAVEKISTVSLFCVNESAQDSVRTEVIEMKLMGTLNFKFHLSKC